MLDLVEIGPRRLPGEVIALNGAVATVQVYEYTGGLRPGDEVVSTGGPLAVDLGPGLLGGVFDGVLRPLRSASTWIEPGSTTRSAQAENRRWNFTPSATSGEQLSEGASLGVVVESPAIDHHVLVPPGAGGRVDWIAPAGELRPGQPVASVNGRELGLMQRWPVRRPRPARARLPAVAPLITGQRVLDLLFPDRPRQHRRHSGRIRHRQDGGPAADRQVVRCVGDRLRRVRRARKRARRRARGVRGTAGPQDGKAAAGPDRADRQHVEHAGDGSRGEHLHGRDGRGVLPRHGLRRGRDRRLDLALGGGAARARLPYQRASGRGGISGGALVGAGRFL